MREKRSCFFGRQVMGTNEGHVWLRYMFFWNRSYCQFVRVECCWLLLDFGIWIDVEKLTNLAQDSSYSHLSCDTSFWQHSDRCRGMPMRILLAFADHWLPGRTWCTASLEEDPSTPRGSEYIFSVGPSRGTNSATN